MQNLLIKYENEYGYTPSLSELYDLYTQGELSLTNDEENALLKEVIA